MIRGLICAAIMGAALYASCLVAAAHGPVYGFGLFAAAMGLASYVLGELD